MKTASQNVKNGSAHKNPSVLACAWHTAVLCAGSVLRGFFCVLARANARARSLSEKGAQNDLRPSGGKMDQMTGDAILSDERAAMGIRAQDDPFEALLVQARATAGLRRVWGVLRVPDDIMLTSDSSADFGELFARSIEAAARSAGKALRSVRWQAKRKGNDEMTNNERK